MRTAGILLSWQYFIRTVRRYRKASNSSGSSAMLLLWGGEERRRWDYGSGFMMDLSSLTPDEPCNGLMRGRHVGGSL